MKIAVVCKRESRIADCEGGCGEVSTLPPWYAVRISPRHSR